MSAADRNIDAPLPSRDEEFSLHRRLLDSDPTAPSDLAVAYLDHLIAWLAERNPRVNSDLHSEAASEAICSLMKRPGSYAPKRQSLVYYLRMAAQADLRNLLRREQRHHQRRQSLESVELSTDAGKYLGIEDDPLLRLQIEEAAGDVRAMAEEVGAGLTDCELRALELFERGARRTAEFARALEIEHLPPSEQERQVKRFKDRVKKRTERAKRRNDST